VQILGEKFVLSVIEGSLSTRAELYYSNRIIKWDKPIVILTVSTYFEPYNK